MTRRNSLLIALLIVASLLLAACGGRTPAADSDQPNAAATAPTTEDDAEAQPTTAPRNTPEPKSTPTTAAATDEGDADEGDADEGDDANDGDADDGAGAGTGDLRQIQQVESISAFRQRTEIQASGDAFAEEEGLFGEVTMEVAYVREPEEAYQITMEIASEEAEGGISAIGIIQIGERSFVDFGGGSWIESSSEATPFDLNQVTILDVASLATNLDDLDEIGTEEVNGRSTTHYRGDREVMAQLNSVEGSDFSGVEEAQIDVWVDREENFIVKMEMSAEGVGLNPDMADAEGSMSVTMEVYDINSADIVIEVPETGGDVSESLGIDMDLPENATVDFAMPGMTSITFSDSSVEEVTEFIEEAMEAAGYEVDETSSSEELGLFIFTLGDQSVTVTVTEADGNVSLVILQDQE